MSKSIYYPIPWSQQKRVKQVLCNLSIPFTFKSLDGECVVVFCDIPINKYSQIRNVFGYEGKDYQWSP